MLSSSIFVDNSIKKYLHQSTNKYIQSICSQREKRKPVYIEYKKSSVKCDLNYMKCEHELSEQDIIYFKEKLSKIIDKDKNVLEKSGKKKPDFLHFYLYFLSTSFFFIFDSSSCNLFHFLKR
jgi:hypothetical protein